MRKIQYAVYRKETGSAGGKAKNDCYDILQEMGFAPSYKPSSKRFLRIIAQFISILRLKKDDILIVQYPTISDQVMGLFLKKIKKVDASIAIVHDIPALQGMGGEVKKQIDELNHFKYLIVHNEYMKKRLLEIGCKAKMISLELFDYLHDANHPLLERINDGTICFAGNLDKSRFLLKVGEIGSVNYNLYGINNTIDFSGINNIKYSGLLNSNDIQYLLDADFGLVWDGDSIDTCSDIYGEYLRINNPHKLSLYLAAGKPVITWKQAAISDFVINNKVGYVVESLRELESINLLENYEMLRNNALLIKRKIADGEYLKKAVNAILKDIEETHFSV